MNSLADDEAVMFAHAVHPTHAARPVGCWAPSGEKLAIEQTSGRQRINIHGCREPSWRENMELRSKKAIEWAQPHSLWVSIDIWNGFVSTLVDR
jgi:hypothetical protein